MPPVRSRSEKKAILVPSPSTTGEKLPPPVVLVTWALPEPEVQRKTSRLRSTLPPVRLRLELNAILVPSPLMVGAVLEPPVELVICVKPEPEVQRKISSLPSALPPVRSRLERKAILVPSPLIEGSMLDPPAALVIWEKPEPEVEDLVAAVSVAARQVAVGVKGDLRAVAVDGRGVVAAGGGAR